MSPYLRIRGTQVGLRDPSQVDRIKAAMRDGTFVYDDPHDPVVGYRDDRGTYIVMDGHHRMAAALEILSETGEIGRAHV